MSVPFTDQDRWLFNSGKHYGLGAVLGASPGDGSTVFRVWAPNASSVSVIGDFNDWDHQANPMTGSDSGVWEATVPGVGNGAKYKYSIQPAGGGKRLDKADPVAVHAETPPKTASVVWDLSYEWEDAGYMAGRASRLSHDAPVSIYECHLGSWSRQSGRNYRDLARA